MDESQQGNVLDQKPTEPVSQDQITPSTPEQVQVVEGQAQPSPETPTEPAQPDPTPAEQPIGYDAFTDDDFKQGYAELCTRMGREFGIRHELVIVDGVTNATQFKNVLVVAKKA